MASGVLDFKTIDYPLWLHLPFLKPEVTQMKAGRYQKWDMQLQNEVVWLIYILDFNKLQVCHVVI